VSGGPGHNAAHVVLDDWPGSPISGEQWRARAAATNRLEPATRRGLALSRLAGSRRGSAALAIAARRRASRPLVARIAR
jgi:hypothetical protein